MEKVLVLLMVMSMGGCASVAEEQAVTSAQFNTTYCGGVGFKSYSEYRTFVSFVCDDGRSFIMRKD